MSNSSYFLDSNIWLYIFLRNGVDRITEEKRKIALNLTEIEDIVVSTQVINEVCINLIKKSTLSEKQVNTLIQDFYDSCTVVELNYDILMNASNLRTQYHFSFWDSLIVASALEAGAQTLYSEDMQDCLIVSGKLQIVNPFKKNLTALT